MLKAIVSYSKKVPAETQFSSEGYSLSLETEIPETDPSSIQARLRDTFQLVKTSVEQELANGNGRPQASRPHPPTSSGPSDRTKASNRQVKYVTDLWTQAGGQVSDLNARIRKDYGVAGLYDLDKKQASDLVDQLKKETRKAA